jgi:hypothetical protein
LRAVKVVYRGSFDHDRPYEREFEGIKKFESHARESQADIFHVGIADRTFLFRRAFGFQKRCKKRRSPSALARGAVFSAASDARHRASGLDTF